MTSIPIHIGKETLYSVEDIADAFGVSNVTIRGLLKSGKIPGGMRIGRRWYVSERNYRRFRKATPKLGTRGPKRQARKRRPV